MVKGQMLSVHLVMALGKRIQVNLARPTVNGVMDRA